MKSNTLKGSILVAAGAASYGMLATFVKMAYHNGFNTAEVTLSQFSLGAVGLFILTMFRARTPGVNTTHTKGVFKLMISGTSLGLTSIFYYLSVQYIPVSIAIVLLMQTVWMGVIMELIIHKKAPGLGKVAAVVIILTGTVLATNLLKQSFVINWTGFGWGLAAAFCYTATMYSSNNVALNFTPLKRSLYMILGGLVIIVLVFHSHINQQFSYQIFFSWGLLVSLFGTILPPLLFTRGMPLTGMGLGAIIASVEIPVAILTACLLLKEPVSFLQWAGVILILFAVAVMNIGKEKTDAVIENRAG